ncbi:hypothetical protein GYMLUDRAFT_40371 [Collybiopsis luxurians FD-317 M1]|uniref:Zn(2)-C6 fungal-type domain-containing protein n=1 Tax=Collybiopsis luxurians FD-317 M1 TaxID=944289 RepID=A0A0D0CWD4_9AGAR|nr:hypothetical protein GYMLUDRAFT_40371 [Collybiopsis luxurians FD-317 M1]
MNSNPVSTSHGGSPQHHTTGNSPGNTTHPFQSPFNSNSHHTSSRMIPPSTSFFDGTHPPSTLDGSLSIEQAEALQAKRYQNWLDGFSNNTATQQSHHQPEFTFVTHPWQSQQQQRPQHQHQQQQQHQQDAYYDDSWMYNNQYSGLGMAHHPPPESSNVGGPSRPDGGMQRSVSGTAPSTPRTSVSPFNGRSPTQAEPPTTTKNSAKRKRANAKPPAKQDKRARRPDSEDDNSDDDDNDWLFEGGISVGTGGVTGSNSNGSRKMGRLPGACTHCKKLKMKCDFPPNDNTCKRCKAGGHVCIVEGRKPRTAPNKREYLLAQIRQKDAIIENLLKQLHNPFIATPLSIASYRMATSPSDSGNRNVLAWLDKLQSSVQNAGGTGGPGAFTLDGRANANGAGDEDDDSDGEGHGGRRLTHAQRFGLVPVDSVGDDGEQEQGGENGGERSNSAGAGDDDALQSTLPDSHVPLGLIANLALSNNKKTRVSRKQKEDGKDVVDPLEEDDLDDDNVGVANETYFMPGPSTDLDIRASLIEQHSPPEILVHGLVTPDDVDKLFEIFYERINPFISLLDPVLHTPATTFARCPFLFTVVCGISSRYYPEKSEIYPIAMHFAKHSAANALIDGWKTVELCQAYILMSIYAVPAKRWEEDRSWLYTGLAIRIATDLNLHQASTTKPQTEKQEREMLNRTRVWMICFNLDRSTATQFGKSSTIKEDYIVRNSQDWYQKSKYNHPYDVHLCGYTALLRIVARFHDEIFSDPSSPSGLNKHVDFRSVTLKHDGHLTAYHEEWERRFNDALQPEDPGSAFRCLLLPFLVAYSRLVMFSFGFQQAYQRGIRPGDDLFFTKCLEAAKGVIRNMVEKLAPSGYLRYSADGHFIFASFASAFLLKLLRPEFAKLLSKEEENEIFNLIGRLIQTLSSSAIAIDDRHTPKLYARFLAGLLSKHRRDGATVGRLQPQPRPPLQMQFSQHTFDISDPNSNTSSMSTFPVAQPQNTHLGGHGSNTSSGGNYMSSDTGSFVAQSTQSQDTTSTPMYRPEITYAAGAGAIQFGESSVLGLDGNAVGEEEMLATMQALKNPRWWENMMMPGFIWPDPASPSSGSNVSSSPTPSSYSGNHHLHHAPIPAMNNSPSYGMFHAAQQVPLY